LVNWRRPPSWICNTVLLDRGKIAVYTQHTYLGLGLGLVGLGLGLGLGL